MSHHLIYIMLTFCHLLRHFLQFVRMRVATSMYADAEALSVCATLITAGQLCFYMPPPHVAHGNSGAGSDFGVFVHGHISALEVCVLQKL